MFTYTLLFLSATSASWPCIYQPCLCACRAFAAWLLTVALTLLLFLLISAEQQVAASTLHWTGVRKIMKFQKPQANLSFIIRHFWTAIFLLHRSMNTLLNIICLTVQIYKHYTCTPEQYMLEDIFTSVQTLNVKFKQANRRSNIW